MNMKNVTFRAATAQDADIIAAALSMAIGEDCSRLYCGDRYMEVFEELASSEYSQYSYRNAMVAEADGVAAGAVIGYDGARLHELRKVTLETIRRHTGELRQVTDETVPGEFYLDSIGVLAEFRGYGIGRKLIHAICERAKAEGHCKAGLLVDFENPAAERLYTSIGFRRVGINRFQGHDMWHMQMDL